MSKFVMFTLGVFIGGVCFAQEIADKKAMPKGFEPPRNEAAQFFESKTIYCAIPPRVGALLGMPKEFCDTNRGSGPMDCYNATPSSLSKELSIELCRGASGTGPAVCYNATPNSLSKELSVQLCQKAAGTGPVACYQATPNSLSKELSVKLCRGARDAGPAQCYRETPSSMNQVDSVELCRIDENKL